MTREDRAETHKEAIRYIDAILKGSWPPHDRERRLRECLSHLKGVHLALQFDTYDRMTNEELLDLHPYAPR